MDSALNPFPPTAGLRPLLSIVIANYNYGRFLEEAILSVLSQIGERGDQVRPDEVELLVVDGGSTDDSVAVVKKYADKLAYWVSEPDKGQSNAFNKGFAKAKGRYLSWLNADDILVTGCLRKILAEMKKHPSCEWFTGNFFRFLQSDWTVCEIGWGPRSYPRLLQRRSSPFVIFGPTSFFSKKIYEEVGRIDERLHYIMDNDLWARFIVRGIKQRRVRCFCWGFRMHEASKTAEFGSHKVSAKVAAAIRAEASILKENSGYTKSKILWFLVRGWRVIDGSFAELLCLRRRYIGVDCRSVDDWCV